MFCGGRASRLSRRSSGPYPPPLFPPSPPPEARRLWGPASALRGSGRRGSGGAAAVGAGRGAAGCGAAFAMATPPRSVGWSPAGGEPRGHGGGWERWGSLPRRAGRGGVSIRAAVRERDCGVSRGGDGRVGGWGGALGAPAPAVEQQVGSGAVFTGRRIWENGVGGAVDEGDARTAGPAGTAGCIRVRAGSHPRGLRCLARSRGRGFWHLFRVKVN